MNYLYHEIDNNLTEIICQLNNISIDELESFNHPDYSLDILLSFKEKLLENKGKRFLIVGDYDCDGICATTIIRLLFNELGIEANHYIPSRSKEGYGLNRQIVDNAIRHGFNALFCVDNGIVAKEEIDYALENDLAVFIIDHHEYNDLPKASAILHPDLFPEEYSDMCAAGICGLLANSFKNDDYISVLAGLATLADMVNVLGYNRYLLKQMIEILKNENISSIKRLLGKGNIDYEGLSFNVIPKINAVSRFDEFMNVNHVVYYLLNDKNSEEYFFKIERINNYRKKWSNAMFEEAKKMIDENDKIIILKSDTFKEGLCGIVANRLMHEYEKPVIVLAEKKEELSGSGRSVSSFNLYDYLSACKDLFTSFGGHSQAVGLKLKAEDLIRLKEYINKTDIVLEKELHDVIIIDEDKIDMKLYDELNNLKPFGAGFKEPFFCLRKPSVMRKFTFSDKYSKYILDHNLEATNFHSDKLYDDIEEMIFSLRLNNYRNISLSLIIEDLI